MKAAFRIFTYLGASLAIVGLFYFIFTLNAPQIIRISPLPDCNLHKTPCLAEYKGQKIQLSLSPRPIPFSDPIQIEVRIGNLQVDQVQVDFMGKSGDTGFKRPVLSLVSPGVYQTETDLTHCQEPEMEWQVTVLLLKDRDTIAIPFQVVTQRQYGDVDKIPFQLTARPKGSDFILKSSDGNFDSRNYRGKYLFIYFGYTFCPDICPTALANLGAMFRQLTPDELSQVQGIFISVDPNRDTLERLQKYTPFFHSQIVGVTGSKDHLDVLIKKFGGFYSIKPKEPGKDYYVVDHSGETYLVDPRGILVESIPHGTKAPDLLQLFRKYKGKKNE